MLKTVIEDLESKYGIDISDFMELYKRRLTKEALGDELSLSQHSIDDIFNKLDLKNSKGKRAACYVKHVVTLSAENEEADASTNSSNKENEYLHNKLNVTQRALQRSRDENKHLRAIQRKCVRDDSFEERVLDLISESLPIKQKSVVNVSVEQTASDFYEDYVSALILSDVHCEEAVSPSDVGIANVYDWYIMQDRLDTAFNGWLNTYRGEKRGVVVCAGDLFTGFIHNALENTSKHPVQAVQELADILNDYIVAASVIFDTVEVPIVNGNHSRLSEAIKSANKGYDLEYMFGHILKAKLSSVSNVTVNVSTTGYAVLNVGDKRTGIMHGDHFRGPVDSESRTFKVYEAFKSITGYEVDHIIQGHTHKFSYTNTHRGSYIVNGSVIGSNSYGVTNGFLNIRPNQSVVSFTPDGEVEFAKQIFLDKTLNGRPL